MNPIADALRDLVSRDEASFSGATRDPAIGARALRARRRRLAARTGIISVSAAALAVSGIAAASALGGLGADREPVAPPLPFGDTQVVIQVPPNEYYDSTPDINLMFGSTDVGCGSPLPLDFEPDIPFSLVVDSIEVGNPVLESAAEVDGMVGSSGNPLRWLRAEAVLETPSGLEPGWVLGLGAWVVTREGGDTIVSSGWTATSYDEAGLPFGETVGALRTSGAVALEDCAKFPDETPFFEGDPQSVALDPGTYELHAFVVVRRTNEDAVMANLPNLGLDASWFRADWRDVVPCADAVEASRLAQDYMPVECLPNLHYQWRFSSDLSMFGSSGARAYAIVDAPASIVGEDQRVMVVSEPVSFTVD